MFPALVLAVLLAALPGNLFGQPVGVLRISVTLKDAAQASVPIAGHALLISDNPATSSPRRVVTGADGTVNVRLAAGNYTVESDEPLAFGGRGYEWTRNVDVAAGREVALALTADNADVGAAPAGVPSAALPEIDRSVLLSQWKDSVVAIWTAGSRASGFVVGADGLIMTSQRALAGAPAVDGAVAVQLTADVKVTARVLLADAARDVAVLWIDPVTTAAIRPLPLGCSDLPFPALADGQRVLAVGAPLSGPSEMSVGMMRRVDPRVSAADFGLAPGSAGGPVFNLAGRLVGLSSIVDDQDERKRRDARIVPVTEACDAMNAALQSRASVPQPVTTRLPVEPRQRLAADTLAAAVESRKGDLSPYLLSSSDFDITFLTPIHVYAGQHNLLPANRSGRGGGRGPGGQAAAPISPTDFGPWTDYFADTPSVLVVRITPRLAESFWTTLGRAAAYTQGVALPAIKHFKPGFLQMRALCGEVEAFPIHPFTIDQRLSETEAIREGLYVFDPQALGPHCPSVKLVLQSEKDPRKPDTRTVDAKTIERIWQDFAPLRDPAVR